jgi:hypothetical protein
MICHLADKTDMYLPLLQVITSFIKDTPINLNLVVHAKSN